MGALLIEDKTSGPNLTWAEFRQTRQCQEGIQKFGEKAIRAAFDAISGQDGNDTLSSQEATGVADPDNAAMQFVAAAARRTIDDVGFRLGRASQLRQNRPDEVRAAERDLGRALGEHGLYKPVTISGYHSTRHDEPTLTEVQLHECSEAEFEEIARERPHGTIARRSAAVNTIAEQLGVKPSELEVTYDREREIVTVGPGSDVEPRSVTPRRGARADYITHHNQALDAWDQAKRDGHIGDGNILVHVDSHSDMYHRSRAGTSIADYINQGLVDGTVNEVYWVLPSDLPATEQPSSGPIARTGDVPYDVTLWVREGHDIQWSRPSDPSQYREVTLHVTDLEHLDAAPLREAENVLLDIDLDYFSNSGHDTFRLWGNNPTAPELRTHLDEFAARFEGVSPALTTVCLSPEYTTEDDQQALLGFFNEWFPGDYIPNVADAYEHHHNTGTDRTLFSFVLDNVVATDNRDFEVRLFNMLNARGFENLARSYREFCDGDITKEQLAARIRAAQSDVGV